VSCQGAAAGRTPTMGTISTSTVVLAPAARCTAARRWAFISVRSFWSPSLHLLRHSGNQVSYLSFSSLWSTKVTLRPADEIVSKHITVLLVTKVPKEELSLGKLPLGCLDHSSFSWHMACRAGDSAPAFGVQGATRSRACCRASSAAPEMRSRLFQALGQLRWQHQQRIGEQAPMPNSWP